MGKWAALVSVLFLLNSYSAQAQTNNNGNNQNSNNNNPSATAQYGGTNDEKREALNKTEEDKRLREESAAVKKARGICLEKVPNFQNWVTSDCSNKYFLCQQSYTCHDVEGVPNMEIDSDEGDDGDSKTATSDQVDEYKSHTKVVESYISGLPQSGACRGMKVKEISSKFTSQLDESKESIKTLTEEVKTLEKELRTAESDSLKDEATLQKDLASASADRASLATKYQNDVVITNGEIAQKLSDLKSADQKIRQAIVKIQKLGMQAADNKYVDAVNFANQACFDANDQRILEEAKLRDMKTASGKNKLANVSDVLTSALNGGAEGEDAKRYANLTAKCVARKKIQDQLAATLRNKNLEKDTLQQQINDAVLEGQKIEQDIALTVKNGDAKLKSMDAKYRTDMQNASTKITNINNEVNAKKALTLKHAREIKKSLDERNAELTLAKAQKKQAEDILRITDKQGKSSGDTKTDDGSKSDLEALGAAAASETSVKRNKLPDVATDKAEKPLDGSNDSCSLKVKKSGPTTTPAGTTSGTSGKTD